MTSRVLVVDDDTAVRDVIVTALTDAGYDCIEAIDGSDAVAKAHAFAPDLVVLDVLMPRMSGDEVQRELRRMPRTRYIPVIFVTAQGETHDKAARFAEGADDYITKPFELEELIARVDTALRRARELRALNPLSGLPGNLAISREIERHLHEDDAAACIYCDLDHFKEFNDHYGFARGDRLIVELARLLTSLSETVNNTFVGHVGGDDFVLVAPEQEAIDLARAIVRAFDALAPTVYDPEDRARGGVVRVDRRGVER
ncbi:MAG TPA: response regulator, partial [Candidatus Limnocylindria bacterium]